MKVLVACEESQRVCTAFREKGHEAYSCDIIDQSGGHPEWHIMQDVLPLINGNCEFETTDGQKHRVDGKWDLIIAHPPCTYLTAAGAVRLYNSTHDIKDIARYQKGLKAKDFFMNFINADCDRIAVENPTPMHIWHLPKYTQVIHPYHFGEPYKKRTCLWIKGLKPLLPTNICVEAQPAISHSWFNKGGKDRAKIRSKTFPGIAKAMAEQWG